MKKIYVQVDKFNRLDGCTLEDVGLMTSDLYSLSSNETEYHFNV